MITVKHLQFYACIRQWLNDSVLITGTACIVCGAGPQHGLCNGAVSIHLSVCLSVPAWTHSSKPTPAGLLLWAPRAGDIDQLLHDWQSAAAAGECEQCHVVSIRR